MLGEASEECAILDYEAELWITKWYTNLIFSNVINQYKHLFYTTPRKTSHSYHQRDILFVCHQRKSQLTSEVECYLMEQGIITQKQQPMDGSGSFCTQEVSWVTF